MVDQPETSRMPAFVHPIGHPISKAAGKDASALLLHYEVIIAELKAALAEMREQRDAWHRIATAHRADAEAARIA
jgi:hypothetical protein